VEAITHAVLTHGWLDSHRHFLFRTYSQDGSAISRKGIKEKPERVTVYPHSAAVIIFLLALLSCVASLPPFL
jgi:hypothetical protein